MNYWFFALLTSCLIAGGCCNRPNGCLVDNINGTRIASPATGTIQYPRLASAADPYYFPNGPATAPAGGTAIGWRPAGTPPPVKPAGTPTGQVVPRLTPITPIPSNNSTFATHTSNLQPGSNLQVAQSTTGIPVNSMGSTFQSNSTTQVASGGMPLHDATRLGQPGAQVAGTNTGIFNRTWEYAVRPTVVSQQTPWPNGPNPNAPGNYGPGGNLVVNGNTTGTIPGQPYNYTAAPYGYGYPQGVIADGWRQRDGTGGISR